MMNVILDELISDSQLFTAVMAVATGLAVMSILLLWVLSSGSKKLARQVREALRSAESAQLDILSAKKTVRDKDQELQDANIQLNELKIKINEDKKESESEIISLKAKLEEAASRQDAVDELTAVNKKFQDEVAALQADLETERASAAHDIASLKERVQALSKMPHVQKSEVNDTPGVGIQTAEAEPVTESKETEVNVEIVPSDAPPPANEPEKPAAGSQEVKEDAKEEAKEDADSHTEEEAPASGPEKVKEDPKEEPKEKPKEKPKEDADSHTEEEAPASGPEEVKEDTKEEAKEDADSHTEEEAPADKKSDAPTTVQDKEVDEIIDLLKRSKPPHKQS